MRPPALSLPEAALIHEPDREREASANAAGSEPISQCALTPDARRLHDLRADVVAALVLLEHGRIPPAIDTLNDMRVRLDDEIRRAEASR